MYLKLNLYLGISKQMKLTRNLKEFYLVHIKQCRFFFTPVVSIIVQCKGQEGVAALKKCKYVNQP